MAIAEGKIFQFDEPDQIRTDFLESFPYEGATQNIVYETTEFSCVCPFSGLPDFGTLVITYIPDEHCVELKSLKYYLVSWRNIGIYQEAATKRIYTDLKKILETNKLKVTTKYNVRGGLHTTCIEGEL